MTPRTVVADHEIPAVPRSSWPARCGIISGRLIPLDSTRVDRWLWSVRAFKTRAIATDACRAGHVSVNRAVTKPATTVRVGDLVIIRLGGRDRVLEVAEVIDKRDRARRGRPSAISTAVRLLPLLLWWRRAWCAIALRGDLPSGTGD